jgi:hypothetical protein
MDSGFLGYSLAAVAISWCTYSASAIFVAVLQLTDMRALVAYPVGLFCTPRHDIVNDRFRICSYDCLQ